MNFDKILSTSDICSDTLLSQVSTHDDDEQKEVSIHSNSKKQEDLILGMGRKNHKRVSMTCVLSEDENNSENENFKMTPKKATKNPFLRNTDSILSSEVNEEIFFNENKNNGFDSMKKSEINKDFLQNLLSQREKISSDRNLKLSQRELILKNLESLMESKSERQIQHLQRKTDMSPREKKIDFDSRFRVKNKSKSKKKKSKNSNKNLFELSLKNRREIPIVSEGNNQFSHSNQETGDKSLQDSIRNLKELGLGESKDVLKSHNSCLSKIKNKKLNISFKKNKEFNYEDCSESTCKGICSNKIQLLKNFFDNLTDDQLMKKEDVLNVFNEIFQDD
jgi:hypothetical protein